MLVDDEPHRAAFTGQFTVHVHELQDRLPPIPQVGEQCGLSDDASARYVAVDVRYESSSFAADGFAAHVVLRAREGQSDRTGEAAVFVESSEHVRYCADGVPRPRQDGFAIWDDVTVTSYVVVTGAGDEPAAAANVFHALELAVTDLRNTAPPFPGKTSVGNWRVLEHRVGAPCQDEPDSVCVPLG